MIPTSKIRNVPELQTLGLGEKVRSAKKLPHVDRYPNHFTCYFSLLPAAMYS